MIDAHFHQWDGADRRTLGNCFKSASASCVALEDAAYGALHGRWERLSDQHSD